MFQTDHYEMFSSFQKDDFFAPCSALCNVPFQCKLQISVAMGPLIEWEVMKILLCSLVILSSRIHSAETEMASAQTFPQIKMQMEGFFTYFCCSYFPSELCLFSLFGDYVFQLMLSYTVISVYSNSTTICNMLSMYMCRSATCQQEHMIMERELQALGLCPEQHNWHHHHIVQIEGAECPEWLRLQLAL